MGSNLEKQHIQEYTVVIINVRRDYIQSIRDRGKRRNQVPINSSFQVLQYMKTEETVSHHHNNKC